MNIIRYGYYIMNCNTFYYISAIINIIIMTAKSTSMVLEALIFNSPLKILIRFQVYILIVDIYYACLALF